MTRTSALSRSISRVRLPQRNTEFQFKAGKLNFSSTSYDWLVVTGVRAQYKGGGVDKFRIRIWSDGGGLVYDNQMDALDSADPTTTLGGGSIVIHK